MAAVVPENRLLCLESAVGVYSKRVSTPLPRVREEFAAKAAARKQKKHR